MTAADHAATVREALSNGDPDGFAESALDALVAQAETAEELRARLTEWETSIATEALKAERDAAVREAEQAREALRQAEPALDELIAWINTDMSGCLEVEARGEAARLAARAALAKDTP